MDKKNHKYPSKDQKKHTHREAIHGHKKRIHWLNAVREEEAEEEIISVTKQVQKPSS